jgi:purine-binding chemotaxis protein CheW
VSEAVDWIQVHARVRAIEESFEAAADPGPDRIEAAYRQRSLRLAERHRVSGPTPDSLQIIGFTVGAERYGLEMTDVAEIIRTAFITPVPGAPPHLAGVINAHGDIRPVLDLDGLLGMTAGCGGGASCVVLLRNPGHMGRMGQMGNPEKPGQPGHPVGLKVERVEEVRSIGSGELRALNNGNTELVARYVKGITPDMLMLLNAQAIIAEFSKEPPRL